MTMGTTNMQSSTATNHTYRPTKPIPSTLLDQATVCFEEQLYPQAFSLLSSALTSGTGTQSIPSHIPPPQHLSLASTLSVHPSLTTRTTSAEKHEASNLALRYLRHVNKLSGPRDSGLCKSLKFSNQMGNTSRTTKRARSTNNLVDDEDDEDQPGYIRSSLVQGDSLWHSAEDFWSVVGWAFNCSVLHPERWTRWRVWLEFVLDVLEADLALSPDENGDFLLTHYLAPFIGQARANKRRLMRALLADGSSKSVAEFGEIFRNETKLAKQKAPADLQRAQHKRKKLDLENEEYGDYLDSDSSGNEKELEPNDLPRASTSPKSPKEPTNSQYTSSLPLRHRLLALLSAYTTAHRTLFILPDELYDLYTEFSRPLPLTTFQPLVLPPKNLFPPLAQTALTQMILCALLATADPPCSAADLTIEIWEKHYAGAIATSTGPGDNAKVGLLVEGLLRGLWKSGGAKENDGLMKTVDEGCKAREAKAAFDGRRKTDEKAREDEDATAVLKACGERMRVLVEMM